MNNSDVSMKSRNPFFWLRSVLQVTVLMTSFILGLVCSVSSIGNPLESSPVGVAIEMDSLTGGTNQ